MRHWTTPAELRAQLERLWDRGDLLRPHACQWPLRLHLKTPAPSDLTEHFPAVRAWVAALAALSPVRLVWREVRHRVQGTQRLPTEAWIDQADCALKWLKKQPEAQYWQQLWADTQHNLPQLLPWLERHPLQALALAPVWPQLLAVVRWIMAHPRPGMYLRQVDLPGIDSKFIEARRGVLSEWLDAVLPAEAVESSRTGVSQFAARYGFLDKPMRIRFRILDPMLSVLPGTVCPDITLDVPSFNRLELAVQHVFITENETNLLAFPQVERAMVIFGAGYGWEALAHNTWLKRCAVYYWGDLDTHGFAILNQLRHYLPEVQSFLMDRATLLAHAAHWGTEPTPTTQDLSHLTPEEASVYDDLRYDRIQPQLRLEQERIGFAWLTAALRDLHANSRRLSQP